MFGAFGDDLARSLINLVYGSLSGLAAMPTDPAGLTMRIREIVLGLAWPFGAILVGFAAGAVAMHQLQVRGLCATRLIAPDPARLWTFGNGPALAVQAQRAGWAMVQAILLAVVLTWTIRAGWGDLLRLSELDGPPLAGATGWSLLHPAQVLGGALLVLGLADAVLGYFRFEAMLRTTPQEQREDQLAMEGDLASRVQRRRIARAWRGHSSDLLTGSSLVLHGPAGLTLVLCGGPPPARVALRAAVEGNAGLRLRRSAQIMKLAQIEAPDLARRLAPHTGPNRPLTAGLIAELAAIWPAR
jgi:flagellar biosynthetic protein FlhB